jgi:hypothetical protein
MIGLVATIALSCCKTEPSNDPGTLQIRISAAYDGGVLNFGDVYYNILDQRIRVEDFKAYLSNITVIKEDNSEVPVKDIYLASLDQANVLNISLEPGNYKGLKFGVGVPEELNKDNDPTAYSNDHPLSVAGAQGMFWEWNTGYIFVKFGGKADLEGEEGNELLDPYAFHCGEDFLYIEKDFSNQSFSISENTTTMKRILFNADQFFYSPTDTIDIAVDYLTHTSGNPELAQRFMDNVEQAIELK